MIGAAKLSDSAFSQPYPGVYSTRGSINGVSARILLDDAAAINFISETFARKNGIQTKESTEIAEAANGNQMILSETLDPVCITMGSHIESIRCAVGALARYDLILGKQWHAHNRVRKIPETNLVRIESCEFHAQGQPPEETPKVTQISRHQLSKCIRRKEPVFAVILRSSEDLGCDDAVQLSTIDTKVSKEFPELREILDEFKDVFPDDLPPGLPPKRDPDFRIELEPGAVPQRRGIYRLSETELQEMRRQLAGLLEKGHIRPSKSPWGAPVLFAPKKDGGLRMCIDYRALNKLTVKNCYPLPRIDDIFDRLQGAQYFTKIDLRSGYHQIRLEPDSIPLTAFRTMHGLFEYLVLPFGLTNAPASFMNLMNTVLHEHINDFVIAYLDDILIFSKTAEDHVKHLRIVLKKLRENSLYGKASKCEFAQRSVEYLGHIVSEKGVSPEHSKVKSIMEWPTPRNRTDIQSFLGLVNFYRRFLKDAATTAKPLTVLTGKTLFKWGPEESEAFNQLKSLMSKAPILRMFDPNLPIFVSTDASQVGIGAVLEQESEGVRRPVAFYSRSLNIHEQRYVIRERELLSIVAAIRHWRAYLYGQKFTVLNDHASLKYLETQHKLNDRQVRWLQLLAQYHFAIVPVSGAANAVADALSRRSQDTPQTEESDQLLLQELIKKTVPHELNSLTTLVHDPETIKTLASEYQQDPEFRVPFQKPTTPYELRYGLLFFNKKLCVPNGSIRSKVLHDHHDSLTKGHLSSPKSLPQILDYYHWKSLQKDVAEHIKTCPKCQQNKAITQAPLGQLKPLTPPTQTWQSITMDFIMPLPETKRKNIGIFVVVDRLSKRIRVAPIPRSYDAPIVADIFFENIYRHHGLPEEIISDRDSVFMSHFWDAIFRKLAVKLKPSSAYHPQTDGQTERMNRKIEEMLRCYVDHHQSNWDLLLTHIEVAYNSAPHSTTTYSPFFLDHGREMVTIPFDVTLLRNSSVPAANNWLETLEKSKESAINAIFKANEYMARYANKKRRPCTLRPGDQVLLSTKNLIPEGFTGARKLMPKYCGPFRILESINDVTFRLDLPKPILQRNVHNAFHASLLRPYHFQPGDTRTPDPPPPEITDSGAPEYHVEKILQHRRRRGRSQYLVKWLGYPDTENSWVASHDLHAPDLLADFKSSL